MIFHRLGLLHKNQRGFTMIELIIAIAITGIITGGITMSIFQVFDGNARTTNHMIAVKQVQSAGYWLSRDAQMGQSVVITGVSGFPLTFTWTGWDGTAHQVVYTLVSSELRRDYDGQETRVAEFIDSDNTNLQFTGGGGGGSAFSLPDTPGGSEDAFTITDPVGGDSGTISVAGPGSVLKVTPLGGATVDGDIVEYTLGPGGSTVAWATPVAGSTVIVTGNATNSTGSWTSTTGTATATMTTDSDSDATLSGGRVLIFTITATVGDGSRAASETRVYTVVPRPNL